MYTLEAEGHEVIRASTGPEALMRMQERPDVIMLDGMLPGITGWEVCRLIKENPATSQIPVIMISAMAQQTDIDRGHDAGATAYITKPFDLGEVVAMVNTALGA